MGLSIIQLQIRIKTNQRTQLMIKSLYQINSALVSLSQQLSNNEVTNEAIKRSIHNLISEVKYLDQKDKYHYYLLIAEIYASRFQNIEEAEKQLQQFNKTLNTEISMNCELRIAFFKYFQQNYKEAYKHLDIGLGEVEEQLKLIDNAKFFFNRAFKKEYLITQTKEKNNFEAGFILSLLYQNEKQYILALKEVQSFLEKSNENFVKFQIYKTLLELYELMKKNSISTISISKKSLETYREDLSALQSKYPHFDQNYDYKYRFVNRIINFIKREQNQQNEKLMRKMLDFKLLAYYKLKKCSKQAPNKEIKMTLQNTAKLIKSSKQTEFMQSILNYDFIKKEYEKFKVLYKPSLLKKLAFQKILNFISNSSPKKTSAQQFKPLSITKQKEVNFIQKQSNVYLSKVPKQIEQPSSTLVSKQSSILKNTTNPNLTYTKMKQTNPFMYKQTISQDVFNEEFEGSKMYKFNSTSQGHQQRFFYVKLESIQEKPRLYYCISRSSKSSNDSYYSLKGLTRIERGKNIGALKRKEAAKFDPERCFSLIFDNGKDRSFYVPDQDDYQRWIVLFQTKILYTEENIGKMTLTLGMTNDEKKFKQMSRTSPPMKKSRKIVDI